MIQTASVKLVIYAGSEQALALREAEQQASSSVQLVILEGALHLHTAVDNVQVSYLAPGCPCCVGLLSFRLSLIRLVRQYRPVCVWVGLLQEDHKQPLLASLRGEPQFSFLDIVEPSLDKTGLA